MDVLSLELVCPECGGDRIKVGCVLTSSGGLNMSGEIQGNTFKATVTPYSNFNSVLSHVQCMTCNYRFKDNVADQAIKAVLKQVFGDYEVHF